MTVVAVDPRTSSPSTALLAPRCAKKLSSLTKTTAKVLIRSRACRLLVQFLPDELAAVDQWIAHQPPPTPSRPQAVRTLTRLGLRVRARPARSQPPSRSGLAFPGLVWELSNGRWVAIWRPQTRFVKRGYPATGEPLWAGVDAASKPTSTEWKSISDRCLKLQRAIYEWQSRATRDPNQSALGWRS